MPRDKRTYITVHDGLPDHPKIEGLSDAAFRLLVTTWCWCSRYRTDGRVNEASWLKRGTARARAELIAAGLFEPTDDGVAAHDYLEHQRTAAEIEESREKHRSAGSKGGKAKAERVASARAVAKQPLEQTASESLATGKRMRSERVADTDTDTDTTKLPTVVSTKPTAQTITAEWIDRVPKRPPGQVVGQVAKIIGQLLDEGIDDDDVRRGLAAWTVKGLHPAALPSVVNETMNGHPRRSRQQAATDDMFARAARRMGVTT